MRSFPARIAKSRFRTIRCALKHFKRPSDVFRVLWAGSVEKVTVELKSGPEIRMRSSTNTKNPDLTVLAENLFMDQYRLKRMARDNMVVVDIGAHIGIFAIVCASYCRNASIYSYEPEESNYALLAENAILNPGLCIHPINKAVTAERGTTRLFLSAFNSGAHTTYQGTGGDFQTVECVTLGDVMSNLHAEHVDLLKLDCEGREYEILMDLDRELLCRIGRIVMETHHTIHTRDQDWIGLYKRLQANGFIVDIYDTSYTHDGMSHLVSAAQAEQA